MCDSDWVCWLGQQVCRLVALADGGCQTVLNVGTIFLSLVCIVQVCLHVFSVFLTGGAEDMLI